MIDGIQNSISSFETLIDQAKFFGKGLAVVGVANAALLYSAVKVLAQFYDLGVVNSSGSKELILVTLEFYTV